MKNEIIPTHYYTEPYKKESLWCVDKMSRSGTRLEHHEFGSKILANEFLEQLTITVTSK